MELARLRWQNEAVPVRLFPLGTDKAMATVPATKQVVRADLVMRPRFGLHVTDGEPGAMHIGTARGRDQLSVHHLGSEKNYKTASTKTNEHNNDETDAKSERISGL